MKNLIAAIISSVILVIPFMVSADSALTLPNPIACGTMICLLIGAIKVFLGGVAAFALFVFIYGGFLMLTSGGNPETIKKAKDVLTWATIGIVIIIISWAIIRYVIDVTTTVTG